VKIAYHYPAEHTIYAQRTIYHGFKHAFADLGHEFLTYGPSDDLAEFMDHHQPDLFITASHFFYRKQLDYRLLRAYRDRGMTLLTKVDFWTSPLAHRVNEARSMSEDMVVRRLIADGLLGDHFFSVVEQGDRRMDGFEQATGMPFATVPLAADRTLLPAELDPRFECDVAYVGTWLPAKQRFFEQALYPLRDLCDVRILGQDWSRIERLIGVAQRAGQYFNLPGLRSLQRPTMTLTDELSVYRSAQISVNVHEEYQRQFGGDCNERTFKIPLAGGFEVTDGVACISRYFEPGSEIVIATDPADWREKVLHYLRHPEERLRIIEAGRARALRDHTYHNRAQALIALARGAPAS
jgi:spore maturation protein CgeB